MSASIRMILAVLAGVAIASGAVAQHDPNPTNDPIIDEGIKKHQQWYWEQEQLRKKQEQERIEKLKEQRKSDGPSKGEKQQEKNKWDDDYEVEKSHDR